MPLNRYIDITFTGNYSLLDRNFNNASGQTESPIPADALLGAWGDIQLEFSELMDTSGQLVNLLKKAVEIDLLKVNLGLIYRAVELLNQGYDKELVGLLQSFGYSYTLDPDDELTYRKNLEKVLKQSKQMSVKIAIMESEIIKAHEPEQGTEVRPEKTLEDWDAEKLILEDEAKRDIDWDKKSVFEYAYRYKNLIKKIQAQKAGNKKWA